MRCIMCGGHATFNQTIFKGAAAFPVRLCEACAGKARATEHMAKIKGAQDHATKTAAVEEFLKDVGK